MEDRSNRGMHWAFALLIAFAVRVIAHVIAQIILADINRPAEAVNGAWVQFILTKDAPEANRKILQPVALKTLFTEDTIIHWGHIERSFFIHAWRFLVLTGLRRGELCGLRNEDIVDGVVTIKRSVNAQQEITAGKNDNARRSFALSDAAKAELDAQHEMLIGMSIISP